MNIGEINKGAVALILVLLFGAGGYLWWSQMYKPAVAAKAVAVTASATAEQGLAAANTDLAKAQQRIDDSKKENAKADDSLARLQIARSGVPSEELLDDAAIVLDNMAKASGVDTRFKAGVDAADSGGSGDTPASSSLQGATPVDLVFDAAGSYAEMMDFMRRVEEPVQMKDGKLYARGRLFNVVRLEIGDDKTESSGGSSLDQLSGGEDTSAEALDKLKLGPNDIKFKVTVRMYTSSTANSQSLGASTPDPAATATSGGTPSGTDATANGGTGGTPSATTPSGDGSTPAATDGAAGGTTPARGTGATGGGTTAQPATAGAGAGTGGN
ncbi:MAG: hypothetical protein JWM98_3165 [Thermoleophilia bacterium]|nr:hypothetical protein [Thermoleophilia bacterium]